MKETLLCLGHEPHLKEDSYTWTDLRSSPNTFWWKTSTKWLAAFKVFFILQSLFTGVNSQCKTYANSGGIPGQNQTQATSSSNHHGECIACDTGFHLKDKECLPDSQGFDLTKLPGIILVISVGGCIIMCLAIHFIQKRCAQKKQKTTQGAATLQPTADQVRNTLSHQQWSCRISRLCSLKVFSASERGRKLEELARQSLAPPIVPYQINQPAVDKSLFADQYTVGPGQPLQTEHQGIQGIQFLDVGHPSENDKPNLSPTDDVMIVLGNPPTEVCTVDQMDKIAPDADVNKPVSKVRDLDGKTGADEQQSQDTTKLVSGFTKLSSNFTSGFGPTRGDPASIGMQEAGGVPRQESWKAEEA